MAPALTEPLSPTNKLSESSSPRPIIINNLLISKPTNLSSPPLSSSSNVQKNNNINYTTNNTVIPKYQKRFGEFQSAFEESIAKVINKSTTANTKNNNSTSILSSTTSTTTTTTAAANNIEINVNNIKEIPNKTIIKNRSEELNETKKTAKSSRQSLGIVKKIELISNGPDSSNIKSDKVVSGLSLSNRRNKSMGPMSDSQMKKSSKVVGTSTTKTNQLDSDIEEAINNTLNNKDRNKQQEQILLKFEEFQHMDLQNCDDLPAIDNTVTTTTSTTATTTATNTINLKSGEECGGGDGTDNSNKIQSDIELSQELISTCTTDTTVTASESDCNIFNENFTEATQQRTPPRTPISSSSNIQNQQITPSLSSVTLTPQSIGSGSGSGMGLQKDFIKDAVEMDQVLGDMDLLQVLKGFDSTSGGGEAALCDLAGSLGLFNDVDVMSYEEIVMPTPKNHETDEIRNEIEKRQLQMQRKCDFLLRRLRKLQARSMSKHTSEEITGLFEWTNRLIRRKDHEQLPEISYDDDKHRPVTQAAMRALLRRIDSIAVAQHTTSNNNNNGSTINSSITSSTTTSNKKNKSTIARSISSSQSSLNANPVIDKTITLLQKYDNKTTDEIGHIGGLLQTEMREIQCAFDSDVTASSSGGESADEMVTYNNQIQQSLSISKRAAWRWARDRSAIASRWTWLCAQISDLEYRIRQHNELYTQIKKNKGPVTFEKNQNLPSAINSSSSNSVNGYRGGNNKQINSTTENVQNSCTTGATTTSSPPNGAYDQNSGSCRTRAFQKSGFRKRGLLQTANIHTISKKAARTSTVKCGCQWPLHPCALCTGRPDPTAPRDLPDTMIESEKVALLDSGFHPVLSFPEDIPNNIHIEATLHNPEWQNRIIRNSSKNSLLSNQKSNNRDDRSISTSKKHRPYQKNKKQLQKDLLTSPTSSSQGGAPGVLTSSTNKIKSTKNRKNYEYHSGLSSVTTTTSSPHQQQFNSSAKSKHRKLSTTTTNTSGGDGSIILNNLIGSGGNGSSGIANSGIVFNPNSNSNMNGFQNAFAESLANLNCDNLDGAGNGLSYTSRSKNSSPTPISGHQINNNNSSGSSYKYERMLERRNRNSYDIDNIVIPYSVAASTRVEILPYKEIPTPKWRVIGEDEDELEEPNQIISNNNDTNLLTTLTDNDKTFLCPKDINNSTNSNSDINMINNNNNLNNDNSIITNSVTTATVELLPPPLPATTTTTTTTTINNDLSKNSNDIIMESIETTNCKQNIDDLDNLIEDISEEAIHIRHDRALLEERKKFSTYLKFPWSTRSRANRRIDSRAESSGANTPDPTSPAPHTPNAGGGGGGGGDHESIPSPAASAAMDTTDGIENINQNNINATTIYSSVARRVERKRTVSVKKDKDFSRSNCGGIGGGTDDQRRSSSPDPREIIPPFEPLQFPLADDLYETMLKMMPNHHQIFDECLKLTTNSDCNNISSIDTEQFINNNDLKFNELSSSINNFNINNTNSSNNSSRKNSTSSLNNNYDLNLSNSIINNSTSIFSISNHDNIFSNNSSSCNNNNNNNNNFNQNYLQNNNDLSVFDSVERQLRLLEESDTDSIESGALDEDPNDPEWKEPE